MSLVVLVSVTGCVPVSSTRYVADPAKVSFVTVWESSRTGHTSDRHAIVSGEKASALVRKMTYERQENPFFQVSGVVGTKSNADAVIESVDGRRLKVAFSGDRFFFWNGPQGHLASGFADLYAGLPWCPGLPPEASTRPAD